MNSAIAISPIDIEDLKRKGKVFRENAGASIIDIGDKVALVEFHTKANALSDDLVDMLFAAVQEGARRGGEAETALADGVHVPVQSRGAAAPRCLETRLAGRTVRSPHGDEQGCRSGFAP